MTAQTDALMIRRAGAHDRSAIQALAERDSAAAPSGGVLLAETGGRLLAALSLEDGAAVADPFALSGEALALLRARRRQLSPRRRPGRVRARAQERSSAAIVSPAPSSSCQ